MIKKGKVITVYKGLTKDGETDIIYSSKEVEEYNTDLVYVLSAVLINDILDDSSWETVKIHVHVDSKKDIEPYLTPSKEDYESSKLKELYTYYLTYLKQTGLDIPEYQNFMYTGIESLKHHKSLM